MSRGAKTQVRRDAQSKMVRASIFRHEDRYYGYLCRNALADGKVMQSIIRECKEDAPDSGLRSSDRLRPVTIDALWGMMRDLGVEVIVAREWDRNRGRLHPTLCLRWDEGPVLGPSQPPRDDLRLWTVWGTGLRAVLGWSIATRWTMECGDGNVRPWWVKQSQMRRWLETIAEDYPAPV